MNQDAQRPDPMFARATPSASADAAQPRGPRAVSEAGDFAASVEERKFVCLFDDGRLLIAEGHEMNPFVLSYRARLDRMGRPYRPTPATLTQVREAYRQHVAGGGERLDHTVMQVLAKELIGRACRERASDIHIRVRRFSTEVYFRIHNELVRVNEHTREHGERLLATLYGAMTTVSDNSYRPNERQDASIGDRDKLPDDLYGVRIATTPTNEGSLMVLRLLYNDAGDASDLAALGFAPEHVAAFRTLRAQPHGMNIISGPTGSGKSTTLQRMLAAQIDESRGSLHVITVEDPIEYPIGGAVQTPVANAPTEEARALAFAAAITNAMRLDPDTIMIGEIRDRASGQTALRASMTGHQVWTTVHANSALAIADRLIDLGLHARMVTDHTVVSGLISQRLVKLLCPHCKLRLVDHPDRIEPGLFARLRLALDSRMHDVYIAGDGCAHCRTVGTIGRTVVAEVILPDARLFEFLRDGDKAGALEYWTRTLGGMTLAEHALRKVAAGLVDPRGVERIVGTLAPVSGEARQQLSLVGFSYGT
ncbi:GspE/PulE family protein [Burkholderia ubonensis]|uniref:GspE/PulE family protein n=1 Tax=Burkholderia ubonensis TaxID=101571 RepID=UPI00075709A9|nr:ATPase, T2SS/T4P/T4SS family [Burkholderia ubonensis]KVG29158.1 secretion system protein E [Burkholderia ubonensis]OJA70139.1 secretion system protein E [Burkholderia ubonensis]